MSMILPQVRHGAAGNTVMCGKLMNTSDSGFARVCDMNGVARVQGTVVDGREYISTSTVT